MQLRIALIAATLAVIFGILVLVVSPRNGPMEAVSVEAAGDSGQRPSLLDPIGAPPALDLEPEWDGADLDEAAINATVERIRGEMLRSINDGFEAEIGGNMQEFFLSPREQNELAQSEMSEYFNDPGWPRISAVPGVSGFEIQVCPETRVCLSDLLASQADDPAWARPMEARIFSEMSGLTSDGLAQVHVVCRETVCGILVPVSSATGRLNLYRTGSGLAEELGFVHHSLADREGFQAIYLSTDEDQPPSMWMQ